MCCGVLQCVTLWCSVLQCVEVSDAAHVIQDITNLPVASLSDPDHYSFALPDSDIHENNFTHHSLQIRMNSRKGEILYCLNEMNMV